MGMSNFFRVCVVLLGIVLSISTFELQKKDLTANVPFQRYIRETMQEEPAKKKRDLKGKGKTETRKKRKKEEKTKQKTKLVKKNKIDNKRKKSTKKRQKGKKKKG